MSLASYKELIVWQKAMDLVFEIYEITNNFPNEERYGLISQMRRCYVSITSNIAEGSRRGSKNEYKHFLNIAFGSGSELETQVEIAKRLRIVDVKKCKKIDILLNEVMRMLNVIIKKVSCSTNYKLQPTNYFKSIKT